MISPQKLSKTIGKNKLKLGLSVNELIVASFFPTVLSFFNVEIFLCLLSFLIMSAIFSLKNLFLEPRYLENVISKRSHLSWDRIRINDKRN